MSALFGAVRIWPREIHISGRLGGRPRSLLDWDEPDVFKDIGFGASAMPTSLTGAQRILPQQSAIPVPRTRSGVDRLLEVLALMKRLRKSLSAHRAPGYSLSPALQGNPASLQFCRASSGHVDDDGQMSSLKREAHGTTRMPMHIPTNVSQRQCTAWSRHAAEATRAVHKQPGPDEILP